MDDPDRVRSQIISVVCQIERDDFDCNLVVTRKVIIRSALGLRLISVYRGFVREGARVRIITFRVTTRLQSKSNCCI